MVVLVPKCELKLQAMVGQRGWFGQAIVALALGVTSTAHAVEATGQVSLTPPPAPHSAHGPQALGPVPLALTVSGGVSLGAYEAGFLYYTIEMLKQYPQFVTVNAAGGASAGSLNALLALMAYCTTERPKPQDSLFWRTWIPMGLGALLAEKTESNLSIFSRGALDKVASAVEEQWKKGLNPTCDVVWGVTATRLFPRNISLAQARLELPRLEEKFSFRLRGQGPDRPPILRNYAEAQTGLEQTLLVEDETQGISFDDVRNLTIASCSFPIAFSPSKLRYCVSPASKTKLQCSINDASTGLFIDGGVLDNTPLRLMARTVAAGLTRDATGTYRWRDVPHGDNVYFPEGARFMFVSPDAADYPIYDAVGQETKPASALELIKQLGATFVSTARTKELYTLLEERPELRERIFLPRRHFPTASGSLSAFFGFFEQDFRIYDFYLGMYDARRGFDEDMRAQLSERMGENNFSEPVYPEEEGMLRPQEYEQWRPMMCMRGVYDDIPPLLEMCQGDELENFRILLQVSLERLYDNCARLDATSLPKTHNAACLAGARGGTPPQVLGVHHHRHHSLVWRRDSLESEFEHPLRLLSAHRFEFKDLGLTRDRSDDALVTIRRMLGTTVASMTAKQPLSERGLLQVAGEFAVDYVAYAAPPHLKYLTFSRSLELGSSHALTQAHGLIPSLRLDALIWFDNLFSFLTAEPNRLAIGPALGLEVMPNRFGSRLVQWRANLRAGYQFAQGDGWLTRACQTGPNEGFGDCSRVRVEALVGMTAFEHVRLQLSGAWYPAMRRNEPHLWSVGPGIGLQF